MQYNNKLLLEVAFPQQIKASSDGRLAFQVREDSNIRYRAVTGVQTCALPITRIRDLQPDVYQIAKDVLISGTGPTDEQKSKLVEALNSLMKRPDFYRSEERRVGKE